MLWFKNRINCILLLSGNKGKGVFIPVFIPVLILVSILFAGCDKSKELNSFACEYKSYKCDGNSSYYCGYSGNDLIWKFSEKCTNGCNSSTGKCKSGNSASTSQDEKTRVGNCTGLPGNAEWNTVSSITQTWNGSSWEPPTTGSYNTTPSTKECRFRCKSFYSWTNSKCVASTQQAKCSSKPANSVWNDNGANGKFTQTWSGSSWKPASYTSTHSTTACECCFECIEDYLWSGADCVLDPCEPNPCWIENATGKCINSYVGKYECECAGGFFWNGNKCADPCEPNPCWIENATGKCINSDAGKYECECAGGFFWNGNKCADPCEPNPCIETLHSTGICSVSESGNYSCGCDSGSVWTGSKCLCPTDQCSPTSGTPCTDSSSGLMWSSTAPDTMNWNNAVSYCDKLVEFGFNDWHLPNIDELRTLIKDRETATGGSCQVSEANNCLSTSTSSGCWSWETCAEACNASFDDCIAYYDGRYSKFGDTTWFWSSSIRSDNTTYAWIVAFWAGEVSWPIKGKDNDEVSVRCVRTAN